MLCDVNRRFGGGILKETETQKTRIEEIRSLFEISPAQYPDRSARWLFKEKENIRGLVEIVASELVDFLDFNRIKEHNRSHITDTLKELESDMIFSVPFQSDVDTDELIIYILIEHQSTVDPMMGFRVLYYMCQIWDEQRRDLEASDVPKRKWRLQPILPIVFYTGKQRWQTPINLTEIMDLPQILGRFVPSFDTLFLGVMDKDPSELTKSDNPFGRLLKVLQHERANEDSIREAMHEVFAHIDRLDSVSASQLRNVILYFYHIIFFRRSTSERYKWLAFMKAQTQDEEVQNMVLTSAEALILQGGIRAKQESILKLMQHKFDGVPDSVTDRITQIDDISRLDTLFEEVIKASTLIDIDLTGKS